MLSWLSFHTLIGTSTAVATTCPPPVLLFKGIVAFGITVATINISRLALLLQLRTIDLGVVLLAFHFFVYRRAQAGGKSIVEITEKNEGESGLGQGKRGLGSSEAART